MTTATTAAATATACFFEMLEARTKAINSHLCVGLDPHPADIFHRYAQSNADAASNIGSKSNSNDMSEEDRCDAAFTFCKTIIDATACHAAAFKPNAAFFEALGTSLGMSTLRRVIDVIPNDIPIILDVKRGDIGSTALAYADSCYDAKNGLNSQAVTLSPLMGWDSIKPFITDKYSNRGAFILCKTSNPGSKDILALELKKSAHHHHQDLGTLGNNMTLFEHIATLALAWSVKAATADNTVVSSSSKSQLSSTGHHQNRIGLVVGATDPSALAKVRKAAGPKVWILAPGVGAQGGPLKEACQAGFNSVGTCMLISVSRAISRANNPGMAAESLKHDINKVLSDLSNDPAEINAESVKNISEIEAYQENFIKLSLSLGVLKFGSFVLKSGRTSPYFFNAGLFSSGGSLYQLGQAYAASIMSSTELCDSGSVKFDVIFGPAYKGITLGAVVCSCLYSEFGVDVGFAYNRKEAKDHGEKGLLVGAPMAGKRVLIIDDVITAGTAIREAHDMLTNINAVPMGVAIALDRAEKRSLEDPISAVQAVARDLSIPVVSIISLLQLQMFLSSSPDFDDSLVSHVADYRATYGVL